MYVAPVPELRFNVVVLDPQDQRQVTNAVAFGAFEAADSEALVYPKEGARAFFDDLILGRPMPLTLITSGLDKMGLLVAIAVFLSRDLAIHPATPNLFMAADFVDRYQLAGLAHIDRDMGRFFIFLAAYLEDGQGRKELESRLATAVTLVRDYILEGNLPALPPEPPVPRILDRGTDGFVVAETPSWTDMELGWLELYRQGFLRGVLFGTRRQDRQAVLVARKSLFLSLNLQKAAEIFNEAERAMGEEPAWEASELWLRGPEEGTFLRVTSILDVLLRV